MHFFLSKVQRYKDFQATKQLETLSVTDVQGFLTIFKDDLIELSLNGSLKIILDFGLGWISGFQTTEKCFCNKTSSSSILLTEQLVFIREQR